MTGGDRFFKAVVMGASAGGAEALTQILSALPEDFPLAILVVQHVHPEQDSPFTGFLGRHCRLPVDEAQDKEDILPGRVFLAPPNYHLLVEPPGILALSVDPKVNHSRPSIDVLFESAARVFGPRLAGVILTGANSDGAAGLAAVKKAGGFCAVQDPQGAAFPTMPLAAMAACEPDAVLPLDGLARLMAELPGPPPAVRVDSGNSFT